jgi:hypothetical protein
MKYTNLDYITYNLHPHICSHCYTENKFVVFFNKKLETHVNLMKFHNETLSV